MYFLPMHLGYSDPEDIFCLNRVSSVISFVLREVTLSILVSTGEPVSIKSERVRVVSLSATEIAEITR